MSMLLSSLVRQVVTLFALLVLSGCCRIPRPEMADSVADALGALRAVGAERPTIRGELRVDHMGPEGRIAGKVYAFASSAGRLRLEAVSPLDTTLRTVTVDSEQSFMLVDQESGRCLHGRAEPCLVGEAVGLELSSEHVGAALMGAVPLIQHERAAIDWDRCGFYVLELEDGQGRWTEEVQLTPIDGQLVATRATIRGPEGVVLEVVLDEHERRGEHLVPSFLGLRMPQSEAHLRVEWREIEVGVTLPDDAWRTVCPAGFTDEVAGCQPRSEFPELEPPGGPEASEPAEPDDSEEPLETTEPSEENEPDLSDELGL